MRYRLRTLLIVLALGPPVLAGVVPRVLKWLKHPPPHVIVILDGPESLCMPATDNGPLTGAEPRSPNRP
jgi:hypothetical protein